MTRLWHEMRAWWAAPKCGICGSARVYDVGPDRWCAACTMAAVERIRAEHQARYDIPGILTRWQQETAREARHVGRG